MNAFLIVFFQDIVQLKGLELITIVIFATLTGGLTLIGMLLLANNKIEGVTLLKGLNVLVILPLLYFVVPSKWSHIFVVIPTYAVYQLGMLDLSQSHWHMWAVFGLAYNLVLFRIGFKALQNKIYSSV